MIFEEYELKRIIYCLQHNNKNNEDLLCEVIRLKLEQLMLISVNKRYSLRTTDWCVENGKKSKRRKKINGGQYGVI